MGETAAYKFASKYILVLQLFEDLKVQLDGEPTGRHRGRDRMVQV